MNTLYRVAKERERERLYGSLLSAPVYAVLTGVYTSTVGVPSQSHLTSYIVLCCLHAADYTPGSGLLRSMKGSMTGFAKMKATRVCR